MAATALMLTTEDVQVQPRRRRGGARGPSRALQLVRERLDNPDWRPTIVRLPEPEPAQLPYEEFCPGAFADEHCTHCSGSGLRVSLAGLKQEICACVYRCIARRCTHEYLLIEHIPKPIPARRRAVFFSMPRHEWAADFWMLVQRELAPKDLDIWYGMRVLQLPWRDVTRRARVDRGTLFHALYRAEAIIGKACLWLKPHSLWPPRVYCG